MKRLVGLYGGGYEEYQASLGPIANSEEVMQETKETNKDAFTLNNGLELTDRPADVVPVTEESNEEEKKTKLLDPVTS